jgi:hypothetical protein
MKRSLLSLVIVFTLTLAWVPVYAANIFTETFDTLTAGTAIATTNTAFDYVRIGSGGGSITAEEATSGELHMRLGGSSSTSLNGVGRQSDLGGATVTTLNFRVKLEDTLGDFFIGMGTGDMFTGNSTFATTQLMWGIQFNNGVVEYRTGSWNSTGQTLTADTNYEFHIVANRSGSTVTYGPNSVANGTMDLFIDGTLVGDDLAIANNQNAAGFRIYQINGSSYARFDSITIDNTALSPFTPTAVTFSGLNAASPFAVLAVGLLAATGLVVLRKRK